MIGRTKVAGLITAWVVTGQSSRTKAAEDASLSEHNGNAVPVNIRAGVPTRIYCADYKCAPSTVVDASR
jgi:hypothetical protein